MVTDPKYIIIEFKDDQGQVLWRLQMPDDLRGIFLNTEGDQWHEVSPTQMFHAIFHNMRGVAYENRTGKQH